MKKSNTIKDIQAEILALKEAAGKRKEQKEDVVCPSCGGDLEFIEEGTVYCPHCDQYFDIEESEEE